jgi:two-component system CheB/CheR fusion protein
MEEFRRSRPSNGALSEAEHQLAEAKSREEIIETLRQTARDICGSDGISFVLREGDMCHYVEEDAIGPLWKGQRFPLRACISGWSMLKGETAVIEDIFKDLRIPHDAYKRTFVKSLIMTPLGERRIAAMGAYWKDKRQFTAREINTVTSLGFLVGKALSRKLDG